MRVNFDDVAVDERRMILVASDAKYDEVIDQIGSERGKARRFGRARRDRVSV